MQSWKASTDAGIMISTQPGRKNVTLLIQMYQRKVICILYPRSPTEIGRMISTNSVSKNA
jgi:hypothetical protein